MHQNKKAFTLIELLVVVLIIGILSAVALPQDQKAVDKARLTEMLIQGRSLLEAQQLFIMANGKWTEDLDALDISLPVSSWTCFAGGWCVSKTVAGVTFEMSSYHGNDHLGLYCKAGPTNTYAQALCVSLGGEEDDQGVSSKIYKLHLK